MLCASNVERRIGDQLILDNVSVALKPGTITALMGPSGAGKSTLLRVLSLLEPPESGKISVDNKLYVYPGLRNGRDPEPWPAISMVFQQLYLWPHLTLAENIRLAASRVEVKQDEGELLDRLGLLPLCDRYPNEMSFGQRQRGALVRAIITQPKYLLLDEITSAQDVEHIRCILEYLQEMRDDGVGLFVATHLVGFARRMADKVVFIDRGKVLEQGSVSILDEPKTKRLERFLTLML